MIEIFVFVNPIGIACFKSEQALLRAINATDKNIRYHYVPISTMETIQADITRRGLDPNDLETHNKIANVTYSALCDYHALALFGNKKARSFMYRLQAEINGNHQLYSKELVYRILDKLKINKNIFEQNRLSKYTKDAISADFDLATELSVKTTPTTIIFDYEYNDNSGILIEGMVEEATLKEIFNHNIGYKEEVAQKNNLKVL